MADAPLKVINENTVGQQMIAYSAASSHLIVFGTNLITVCVDFSSALSKKKKNGCIFWILLSLGCLLNANSRTLDLVKFWILGFFIKLDQFIMKGQLVTQFQKESTCLV